MSKESIHSCDVSIRNIATGVTAPPSIILHKSKSIIDIKLILASTEGQLFASKLYRMKDQAVTTDSKSAIKIQDKHVHVHPQLLFQVGMKNDRLWS